MSVRDVFESQTAPWQERITLVTGDSQDEASWPVDRDFVLAVVDADHFEDPAFNDMNRAWERLQPSGVLLCHDYDLWERDGYSGVDLAFHRFIEQPHVAGRFDGPFCSEQSSFVWIKKHSDEALLEDE